MELMIFGIITIIIFVILYRSYTPNVGNDYTQIVDHTATGKEITGGLFDNVAGKIKILAQVFFWVGVAASCITAIVLWADGWEAWLGLVVIVGGPLVFWLIALPLYGFGQLIENTEK